jgi:hypothetical protein
MNILYEGLKQKGGMMVVPSSIVDSMGPQGTLSLAALAGQRPQREEGPTIAGELVGEGETGAGA